jgi:hypothetical protein
MSARTRLAPEDQLTIDELLSFTDSRPDGERWELIEGVAALGVPMPLADIYRYTPFARSKD